MKQTEKPTRNDVEAFTNPESRTSAPMRLPFS